jgi:flagellar motility protein MotE (MotC chaperone)
MKDVKENILVVEKKLSTEIKNRQEIGQEFQKQINERSQTLANSFSSNTKGRIAHVIPQVEQVTNKFVPIGFLLIIFKF